MSHDPCELSRTLVALLAKRDLDGVMRLYEPEAIFAELDGVSTGAEQIRKAHDKFLAEGLDLGLKQCVSFEADDIALVHWTWTVTDPDGNRFDGSSAEVLRRQADGTWRFLIDNSDGPALVGRF